MNECQKADPKARRQALFALFGIAVIGAMVIWTLQSYRQELQDWVSEDQAQLPFRIKVVLGVAAALVAAPLLAFAFYCWSFGSRVVQARQFPPPGSSVIRDTIILRNQEAERRGRGLQAFGIILVLAACLTIVLLWLLADALAGDP